VVHLATVIAIIGFGLAIGRTVAALLAVLWVLQSQLGIGLDFLAEWL